MSIDLNNLPIRERRAVHSKLREILFDHPEFKALADLNKALEESIEGTESYKKGMEFYEKAMENGLDSGYASASDYYFAVVLEDIEDTFKKQTYKNVYLVLCFKHNWWMNNQSYRNNEDGPMSRNFHDFVSPKLMGRCECGSWGETQEEADELREELVSAGMEEKKELADLYLEACKTI